MALPFSIGEILEVRIEKLSYGPAGIARKDGFVLFVDFSAPGDLLEVQIIELHSRHAEAKILRIIEASPHRVEPRCSVYGKCGGCDWQHLNYATQLQQKQEIVEGFLRRSFPHVVLQPIVPSPQEFSYRNRVQLKFKNGDLGFYMRGSHDIIDINTCPLLEESLDQTLPSLKSSVESRGEGKIDLRLLKNGEVSTELAKGKGFSQVNRWQNEALVQLLLARMDELASDHWNHFFDLYAGDGNFTFPVLDKYRKIRATAVESHGGSAQTGREQLGALKIGPKRAEFYCSTVENFLRRTKLPADAVVLVDPPRTGCEDFVMRTLAQSNLCRLFYISCDPAALDRDLKRLQQYSGQRWSVHYAQSFDMFPQTHHVETFLELTPL